MTEGKIFLGGLSWETSEETLREYFGRYGEIIDCVIMKDKATGHPRGFGFVTYSDPSVVDTVLNDKHVLDGRQIEAKRAVSKEAMAARGPKTKKIFVGGLPSTLSEADFRKYFEQFGRVVESQIMHDHETGRPRGFGFVTFASEDDVERVIENPRHTIQEKLVEVKKAEPKQNMPQAAARLGPGGRLPSPLGFGYYPGAGFGGRGMAGMGYGMTPFSTMAPMGMGGLGGMGMNMPPYGAMGNYGSVGKEYLGGMGAGIGMMGGGLGMSGAGMGMGMTSAAMTGMGSGGMMGDMGSSYGPIGGAPMSQLGFGASGLTGVGGGVPGMASGPEIGQARNGAGEPRRGYYRA
eukprot:tig00020912_g15800.t2